MPVERRDKMRHTWLRASLVMLAFLLTLGAGLQDAGAITGGQNDSNSPAANVVVSVDERSGNGHCTGTLITPTAVLTAKHCVTGSTFGDPPIPPAILPFSVMIGGVDGGFSIRFADSTPTMDPSDIYGMNAPVT